MHPQKIVYIDTCVWVSLFEGEKGRFVEKDQIAINLLNRCLDKEFKIVISNWLLKELRGRLSEEHVELFNKKLEEFERAGQTVNVSTEKGDVQHAKSLSSEWDDALHAILAKRAEANILLTWNLKHFVEFKGLVNIASAQEF